MSRRPLFPPVFEATRSHPLIDDFTLRAQRLRVRQQPPGLAVVQPLPLRNHPMWSGNSEIGSEVAFAPDANNTQMVLKMEEWGPPEVWTLTLGLAFDVAHYDAQGGQFALTAIISFGVGGTTQQVEVDWKQGTSITLTMNALSVAAKYTLTGNEANIPLIAPEDLLLRATLSQGPGRDCAPSRSVLVTSLDGTGFASPIAIPVFSKALYLLTTGTPNPIDFYSSTDSVDFTSGLINPAIVAQAQRSQFVSFISTAEQMVGAPVAYPVPEYARALDLNAIVAPGLEGTVIAQFELGL